MTLEDPKSELISLAKALAAISKEISYRGVATALLKAALQYSSATRGMVRLREGSELLAKADASFSRERARIVVSDPPLANFDYPEDIEESSSAHQEPVVARSAVSLFHLERGDCPPDGEIASLRLPLIHQGRKIGILYLESYPDAETFTPKCVSVMSILASQTAAACEGIQLFEALRETNLWMVKGQQLGRMGSYRWNTRTLLSRASRECYRIFDIDADVNPVPFEIFRDRIHPDDRPDLERHLTEVVGTRSAFSHEYRVVHRDGRTLSVIAVGEFDLGPSGDIELEGIITDVTEQKAAEQALTDARSELTRAARLVSLGELAASIVHEVKQPLTGIIASGEACLRWLAHDPAETGEASKSVSRIIELGRRASGVVTSLRCLVRDTRLQISNVEINEAIQEVLLILKRDLERSGISLRTELDTTQPSVEADRVQIQQVVLNLVRNAIDAMMNVNGRARVLTVLSKRAADHVLVSIADAGPGIDPPTKERLFDALNTTKADGLGLGLSISRKLISAHGGRLWLEQSTAQGATFAFALPFRQDVRPSGLA